MRKMHDRNSGFPRFEGWNAANLVIELGDKMRMNISEKDIGACHRI